MKETLSLIHFLFILHPSSFIPHPSSLILHPSSFIPHPLEIYPAALRRGDEGAEVARESFGVVVEKLAHAFEAGRADDEADVVRLVHAEDDLLIRVSGGVGALLPRERERDAAVLAPRLETPDAPAPRAGHLDARPLAPEVVARRRLQGLSDVRAADARGDFKEVELSVFSAAYELGVRRAAFESECGEQFTVQARQPLVLARVVLDCVRGEDAALLRHAQRGPTVLARAVEYDFAALDDRVNVEDFAAHEFFEKVVGRPVLQGLVRVERFDCAPDLFRA